jgi:hypothetical protein
MLIKKGQSRNIDNIRCKRHNEDRQTTPQHKKIKISLADVLGNIVKNPLILKKESDGSEIDISICGA